MEIRFKTWLENKGEVIAGNGKVKLLQFIDELGSIQKAADEMGMSYRHAWGFIQKIEQHAGTKFVETQTGGKEGGGAKLTPAGKDFLQRYTSFCEGLDEYIKNKFEAAFSGQPSAFSKSRKRTRN